MSGSDVWKECPGERIGASHGTAGWTCKAACHAADLERLRSARRSLHRELVGAVQAKFFNLCLKGLKKNSRATLQKISVGPIFKKNYFFSRATLQKISVGPIFKKNYFFSRATLQKISVGPIFKKNYFFSRATLQNNISNKFPPPKKATLQKLSGSRLSFFTLG